jgi:cell division protein FtsN
MPPRRRTTPADKRQSRRNTRTKPGRTPVWLWLIGGIAVGAVLAVALFFQDAPRGGHDTDVADKKTEKKTKAKPSYTEQDYQLEDLHGAGRKEPKQSVPTIAADTPPKTQARAKTEPRTKPVAKPAHKAPPKPPPVAVRKPPPKPTTKTKTGTGARYWLQAGAFRSKSQADNLKARLILSGLPVRVIRAQVRGRTWYRVRIGPYSNNASMNRAKTKLRRHHIEAAVIKERS